MQFDNTQQVDDLRVKLGGQENTLLVQKKDIARLQEAVHEKEVVITRVTKELQEKESKISEMKSTIENYDALPNSLPVKLINVEEKDETINLGQLGTKCLGEGHQKVIDRQKEALAELRIKLKQLEEAKPPVPRHEAALREIVQLRQQLNQLQAGSLTQDHMHSASALEMKAKVDEAKVKMCSTIAKVSAQENVQKDTSRILEMSENSYFNLLNSTCKNLRVDLVKDSHSFMQASQDERHKIWKERQKVAEVISRQINELTQHIDEKDHIISSYDHDLQSVKKASEESNTKLFSLESAMSNAECHAEQNSQLRANLSIVQEELDQQQRLSQALLRRKSLSEKRIRSPPNKHSCVTAPGQANPRQSMMVERLKKKDFEISQLKENLENLTSKMDTTTARLQALEQTV